MFAAGESLLKERQPLGDLIGGVDIERRAIAACERLDARLCRSAKLRQTEGERMGREDEGFD